MQNLCSDQRMKIWNYIHFKLRAMEVINDVILPFKTM